VAGNGAETEPARGEPGPRPSTALAQGGPAQPAARTTPGVSVIAMPTSHEEAAPDPDRLARRPGNAEAGLRRSVFAELLIAAAVLVATSLLVNDAPARQAASQPFSQSFQVLGVQVNAIIQPRRARGVRDLRGSLTISVRPDAFPLSIGRARGHWRVQLFLALMPRDRDLRTSEALGSGRLGTIAACDLGGSAGSRVVG
jgi:hypothetical protein